MKITCVINVRNGEAYLKETLASVFAQSIPVELLVVDNQSVDKTPEILRDLGVRVERTPYPMTLGAARQYSLNFVSTEFVGWLDADDLWEPNFCEESVKAFQAKKNIVLVSSGTIFMDAEGKDLDESLQRLKACEAKDPIYREGDSFPKMVHNLRTSASWQSYVFRTDSIRTAGAFNTDLKFAVDLDLVAKLLLKGNSVHIGKNLSRCRVHANQITQNLDPAVRFGESHDILADLGKRSGYFQKENELKIFEKITKFRIALAYFLEKKSWIHGVKAFVYLLHPKVSVWFVQRMLARKTY